jgi:hypothetical protein
LGSRRKSNASVGRRAGCISRNRIDASIHYCSYAQGASQKKGRLSAVNGFTGTTANTTGWSQAELFALIPKNIR